MDGVSNSVKHSRQATKEEILQERRKSSDRGVSADETRFPFIDDDCKLIMKDRKNVERRTENTRFKNNPLKMVNNTFRK